MYFLFLGAPRSKLRKNIESVIIINAPKYQVKKLVGIPFCKNQFIKENTSPYSILLPKVRGETCVGHITYQGRL